MGIDQWEWEGMGILIVFPHTSAVKADSDVVTGQWTIVVINAQIKPF